MVVIICLACCVEAHRRSTVVYLSSMLTNKVIWNSYGWEKTILGFSFCDLYCSQFVVLFGTNDGWLVAFGPLYGGSFQFHHNVQLFESAMPFCSLCWTFYVIWTFCLAFCRLYRFEWSSISEFDMIVVNWNTLFLLTWLSFGLTWTQCLIILISVCLNRLEISVFLVVLYTLQNLGKFRYTLQILLFGFFYCLHVVMYWLSSRCYRTPFSCW